MKYTYEEEIQYTGDERLTKRITMEIQIVTAIILAANIIVALKHPGNVGDSRIISEDVLRLIGEVLVREGIMSADEFELFKRGELEIRMLTNRPLHRGEGSVSGAAPWVSKN
jgi:hypothetical protein